jgi:transcriptional regulator with XRE-family HTH domain
MRELVLGRMLRMIRLRADWTQSELADRAGISTSVVSRIENGHAARYRLATIQRHGDALGMRIEISAIGRGGDAARLGDEEHAAIVEWLATTLTDEGWLVVPEASFSVYGERGRIDLLAFHPPSGTLLVVEVKTELADLQELLGSLDVKSRHATAIAVERGWQPERIATLLAVADTSANREVVRRHATLFGRFERHAGRIAAWIHRPRATTNDLLLYVPAEHARRGAWLATRRRVRH